MSAKEVRGIRVVALGPTRRYNGITYRETRLLIADVPNNHGDHLS